MAKHLIFFAHGMGTHSANWYETGLTALKNSFNEYRAGKELNFDELFEHKPLVYNNVFNTWHNRMTNDFTDFKKALVADMDAVDKQKYKNSVSKQLDDISNLIGVGKNDFFWTHALDVILYRFSSTIRMAVDVSIADQLLKEIKGGFQTWSIVGHSLGTSVVHNFLNSLYSTGFTRKDGSKIVPLQAEETRAEVLVMVSNVSRVIQRPGAKVYETPVKSGFASSGRLCASYLNIRHRYDPFVIAKPFDPDSTWLDAATFASDDYQHIRPSHIAFDESELGKVHSLEHYVINPRVHVPIFREILGRDLILDDEFATQRAKFDEQHKKYSIERIRKILEKKFPHINSNWESLISVIKRFLK